MYVRVAGSPFRLLPKLTLDLLVLSTNGVGEDKAAYGVTGAGLGAGTRRGRDERRGDEGVSLAHDDESTRHGRGCIGTTEEYPRVSIAATCCCRSGDTKENVVLTAPWGSIGWEWKRQY